MKTRRYNKWIAVVSVAALFAFGSIENAKSIENLEVKNKRNNNTHVEAISDSKAKSTVVKKYSATTVAAVDLDYWIRWKRQIIQPIIGNNNPLLPARPGC